MDWTSFGRVRTAMTVRDYDIVMLALKFDEGIEEPTTDSFDWIRKLRSQPGFPEMIILAEGGSELVGHPHAAARRRRLSTQAAAHAAAPAALHQADAARHREGSAAPRRTPGAGRGGQSRRQRPRPPRPMPRRQRSPAARRLPPAPTPIATHTGATLARAAQLAVAANPAVPRRSPRQTGASLARAARAALTPVPAPRAAAKLEASAGDVSAVALPAAGRLDSGGGQGTQTGGAARITRFRATPSCRRSASPKPRPCTSRSPRISATTSR